MKKSEIPKGCYGFNELRGKLKIKHQILLQIIRHHDCPVAGQYHSGNRHKYNYYYLPDIKKFIKTGKRADVNTKHTELKEWEVPQHTYSERQFCQQARRFYQLTFNRVTPCPNF